MRAPRIAILLAAMAVLAACGSRATQSLQQQAAQAALGSGGGGNGQVGTGTGSGNSATGTGTGSGLGGSGTTGTGSGVTSGTGGGTGPGASAAPSAPAGGNGGSTDIGVTGTSITVANVSTISGPVPGLFEGAVRGTKAFFAYINSQGGIYGRQLKLSVVDDQFDCGQNKQAYQNSYQHVFGFVGSFSLFDACGAQVLQGQPSVSAVQYALSPQAEALKNNFSPQPLVPGRALGPFIYYKQKYGDKIAHAGSIYGNVQSAVDSWNAAKAAAEHEGFHFVYTRATSPGESDFTSDVVSMKAQGVQLVYILSEDISTLAKFDNAVRQQSWNPVLIEPVAFDSSFFQQVSDPNGIVGEELYSLFFTKADGQAIPEDALYQQWMDRLYPGAPQDLFSMYAWSSARLFSEALIKAGAKLTRANFQAAIRGIHKFDANGMLGVVDPSSKVPPNCYVLWQITNNQYVRVDTPAGKYRCDAPWYYYHG